MLSEFIVPLETVRQSDVPRVGAKTAVLGTLVEARFPVPPGLCVTTDAFLMALGSRLSRINNLLREHDLCEPTHAAAVSGMIAGLLDDLQIPAPVIAALYEALPSIATPGVPLAVRSSATVEDAVRASFAGQYVTVLGVSDKDAVRSAIVDCWHSFYHPNALVARATHAGLGDDEGMAILIQPMIDAECAGVCFSIDPVQQRRDLIVVNSAWGLGAGVVDGSVGTATAWVSRHGFATENQRVSEQVEQLTLDPRSGLQRVRVPDERRHIACLPEAWCQRVAQFGVAAEVSLGRPQELEWAVADGQVWVLQSRPITALPLERAPSAPAVTRAGEVVPFPVTWEDEPDRRRSWTLMHPFGREGDVLLPIERDYLKLIESMRDETCRFLGADRNGKVAFLNGRAYFCHLPIVLTDGDRRVRRAAMEDLKERLHSQGMTAWDYWGPEIVRATERLRAFDRNAADGPELAGHLEDALAVRRRHYMLHPMCWFKPRQPYFNAFSAVSGLSGDAAEAMAYQLLDAEETPLTRLVDDLYALACTARCAPVLAALVADPSPDALERLSALPEAATFRAQLDDLLKDYGERNGDGWGSEATLLTPTWREEPGQVLSLIAPYLDPNVESPAMIRTRARQKRDAQIEALCDACTDQEAVAEFRRQLAYARKTMAVLEYHNHYIDQLAIGQLRHAVLAAADWLVAHSVLTATDEVYWLYFNEILAALRADAPGSCVETVTARQVEHAQWQKLEPPPLLGVPEAQLPERPPLQVELTLEASPVEGHLNGLGASPGRHRGRARVVSPSVPVPDVTPGDVLVAHNVGPRWTPIFAILGALVLDGGALGQHAAATAREYGVPAVIGTQNATQRILEGAWVTVDGTTGTVELETLEESATL
jgi:phosphohistidine swiveling domain-containing protein